MFLKKKRKAVGDCSDVQKAMVANINPETCEVVTLAQSRLQLETFVFEVDTAGILLKFPSNEEAMLMSRIGRVGKKQSLYQDPKNATAVMLKLKFIFHKKLLLRKKMKSRLKNLKSLNV